VPQHELPVRGLPSKARVPPGSNPMTVPAPPGLPFLQRVPGCMRKAGELGNESIVTMDDLPVIARDGVAGLVQSNFEPTVADSRISWYVRYTNFSLDASHHVKSGPHKISCGGQSGPG